MPDLYSCTVWATAYIDSKTQGYIDSKAQAYIDCKAQAWIDSKTQTARWFFARFLARLGITAEARPKAVGRAAHSGYCPATTGHRSSHWRH